MDGTGPFAHSITPKSLPRTSASRFKTTGEESIYTAVRSTLEGMSEFFFAPHSNSGMQEVVEAAV